MNLSFNQHRWLVVDDGQTLLKLATTVLRTVPGSDVVACGDACAALEIFFAGPESFELVVTDFNMPGMDGLELVQAVHECVPTLKILNGHRQRCGARRRAAWRSAGAVVEAVRAVGAACHRAGHVGAVRTDVRTHFACVSKQAVRSAKLCVTPLRLCFLQQQSH